MSPAVNPQPSQLRKIIGEVVALVESGFRCLNCFSVLLTDKLLQCLEPDFVAEIEFHDCLLEGFVVFDLP